ncbi:Aste57867_18337 [Aphanomyces stellatus]|uniref:phosphatidylinositol-3,4-bisphosphate 4-phosphatase n=1 Tax=Aphanomyces stellatus TaxID=120398 RepID=A0A485LAP7_9STRA|nr:hypothetical protein As57867_018275 [Aphanomyces stellatus]VFT95073.1 Aste57867_18337 [Aphanomyces stellatus]
MPHFLFRGFLPLPESNAGTSFHLMMAGGDMEPLLEVRTTDAPPAPTSTAVATANTELTSETSQPVETAVLFAADVEPDRPFVRPPLDPAMVSFRSVKKETIPLFVACTNLNMPNLPQTFFQSIFKGKKPDSNLPECRLEVDLKPVNDPKSVLFHQTTEARRAKNPTFSMGITIPVPLAKPNSDEYHLHFRVVQTDIGMEKTVATTELMCGMLLESFKQGTPVVHLPLSMAGNQEAILSLTFARVFPIKHTILPAQNTLMHTYAFPEPKDKESKTTGATKAPLLASEEIVEVGFATSIPPLYLQQCHREITAAHKLWSVRYNNARKTALEFATDEEAMANGCDVYTVEVISGKGLALPADLNLQPSTPVASGRARSNSGASKDQQQRITCNPFVSIKFKEATKGKRPVEISEGKTSVEKNTGEPHWGANNTLGKPQSKAAFVFYRPKEDVPAQSLKRTLELDVLSECETHFDGEIPLGKVTLPIEAVMYEGGNATYKINLTRWFPVIAANGEPSGEILVRLQMRGGIGFFSLEPEPALALGSLFQLADPKRQAKWQATLDATGYTPPQGIPETQAQVVALQSALDQVAAWQSYIDGASNEWFRSSELKVKLEVQPLATNLHASYFRLYKGQEPARETVLEGRPRDVEIDVLPGEELDMDASTRRMLSGGGSRGSRFSLEDLSDHDAALQVESTVSTVTCGAPTAHALGLSQFGLVELEDKLLSVDAKSLEATRVTYALRKAVCMSQSLSVLAATFTSQLELVLQKSIANHEWLLEQWATVGFLIGWESLVSTQGKELHMLSDAWVAIKSLERVKIQLVSNGELMALHATETGGYVLQLPLPSTAFRQLPKALQDGKLISVTVVLFTQGINEMQTLANVVGAIGIALQVRINDKCFLTLRDYHEKIMATPSLAGMTAQMKTMKLDALSALIANSNETTMTKKNHRILLEASDDIRRLNGGRVTFCKSGKDRTAMSVTLDQARILGSVWKRAPLMVTEATSNQDWAFLKPVANLMREFGVRIEVAKKNVGHPRYSFNSLQRKMLPKMYRPPHGAIKGDHDVDDS